MDFIFIVGLIVCVWAATKTIFYVLFNVVFAKPFKWKTNNNQYWAVITGSTDGLGYEFARQLGRKGYNLMLISRNQEKLDQTRETILKETTKIKVETLAVDFGHTDIYDKIKIFLKPKLNDIYILINNVGIAMEIPMPLYEQDEQFHDRIMNINVVAATKMTRMILPSMIQCQRGLVVFLSSTGAVSPLPMINIYGATKAYLSYLSRALIQECSPNNVLVYLLYPAFLSTKMTHSLRTIFFRIPTAEEFVRQSLKNINWSRKESTGNWSHTLLNVAILFNNALLASEQVTALFMMNFLKLWVKNFDPLKPFQTLEEKRQALEIPLFKGIVYSFRAFINSFFRFNNRKNSNSLSKN